VRAVRRNTAADAIADATADDLVGPSTHVGRQMMSCALRTLALLRRRRLHLHRDRIGTAIVLPGGRPYLVFRESVCDDPSEEREVTLLVWFQLKGTGPDHPWRSWLFERESILNTVLYAGCTGFERKLWLVDRTSAAYAGLYTWRGEEAARRYARYITAVLRPLSVPGSVGSALVPQGAPS
jgi:hypothetical protein